VAGLKIEIHDADIPGLGRLAGLERDADLERERAVADAAGAGTNETAIRSEPPRTPDVVSAR